MDQATQSQLVGKALELGLRCYRSGNYAEAEAVFSKALTIAPDNFDANHFMGIICLIKKQFEPAVSYLLKAIKLNPESGDAYHHMGFALLELDKKPLALEHFKKAISLKPNLSASYRGMGDIYSSQGDLQSAIEHYQLAINYDPVSVKALNNLGNVYKTQSRLKEAVSCYRKARQADPGRLDIFSNELMCLATDLSVPGAEYLKVAKEYARLARKRSQLYTAWPALELKAKKVLRIGFVAADFRRHVVAKLFEGALRKLSEYPVELIAYHNNWMPDDAVTERMKPCFSEWNDVFHINDPELAKKIYADRIDILIDMSGHSAHNRLPVFAYKPSPVQLSWMGFFASTGLTEIDYFGAGKVASPVRNNPDFTEEVWQFKSSQCLAMLDIEFERQFDCTPYQKNGFFTFGCMNRVDKVSDEVIRLWAEILHELPDARFYIDSWLFGDEGFKQQFITRLEGFGVSADRFTLASHDGTYAGYLSAFREIDLVLDTFPYNGSTVNMEALWMGVPYVSLMGSSVISRTGAAMLEGVNLQELVAADHGEYVQKAVDMARYPDKLMSVKNRLRESLPESGFFNPEIMAQQLFTDFTKMWSIFVERASSR
ncbi:tetratricopeptide repeat protein [Neptuniibacter halophilus]|uniref:tetratricopeptide repeat protein n=1 Tax=Neptuniibacter halophilus TaxID=651666 RepID=UPI002572F290|nr:tetratricopeptide repeat protein [Neptuniibacter halophilus]